MSDSAVQVLNQPFFNVEVFREAAHRERSKLVNKIPTKEIFLLGLALMILQVLDGVLTAYGIKHFGLTAEGNPFLRHLMVQLGYVPALIFVKAVAIMIIGYLCSLSNQVVWMSGALKGMIGIYLFAAIIPWSAILYKNIV